MKKLTTLAVALPLALGLAVKANAFEIPTDSGRDDPVARSFFIDLAHDHHVWAEQHGEKYKYWRNQEHDPELCIERPLKDFEKSVFYMTGHNKNPRNLHQEAIMLELIRKRTRDTFHPGAHLEPGKKRELEIKYHNWLKEKEAKQKEKNPPLYEHTKE